MSSYTKWDRTAYIERAGGEEEAEQRRKAAMGERLRAAFARGETTPRQRPAQVLCASLRSSRKVAGTGPRTPAATDGGGRTVQSAVREQTPLHLLPSHAQARQRTKQRTLRGSHGYVRSARAPGHQHRA